MLYNQVAYAFRREQRRARRVARPLHRPGGRVAVGNGRLQRGRRPLEHDLELARVAVGFDVGDFGDVRDRRDGRDLIGRDPAQVGLMLLGDADRPPRIRAEERALELSRCAGTMTVSLTSFGSGARPAASAATWAVSGRSKMFRPMIGMSRSISLRKAPVSA